MSKEYRELREAYKPDERLAPPPDDRNPITAFEVGFTIPVFMSVEQEHRLHDAVSDIIDSPYNTPVGGVHWLAGGGCKPNWSNADRAVLGKPRDPNAPDSGEPTFDDSVLYYESAARGFVTMEERDRKVERRKRPERTEKERRIYYQDIVYAVCNLIDVHRGDKRQTVCGTVDSPSTEVQDTLKALLANLEPKF